MSFAIFRLFVVLYICCQTPCFGQQTDNAPVIELSTNDFFIERPFAISLILPNSNSRPEIIFPTIPGLSKRAALTSTTTNEINGKEVITQIITQTYIALKPGSYPLAPFALSWNGIVVRSPGTVLTVRPSATKPTALTASAAALALAGKMRPKLVLTASSPAVYTNEGVLLKLSFLVAENYPYELRFDALERQLTSIIRQVRPVNAWEESAGISELKPRTLTIGGQTVREYNLYQATFFPLNAQPILIPSVNLTVQQLKPLVTATQSTTQTEQLMFSSQPVRIAVRPLPLRASTDPVLVGRYHLAETLERTALSVGQSVRYDIRLEGEGNISAIQPPTLIDSKDFEVFPPDIQQTINRTGGLVTGQKTFRYFLVPKRNGAFALGNTFQWVYFDPTTARYDTLRSQLTVRVGGMPALIPAKTTALAQSNALGKAAPASIYTGIELMDSTRQPLNIPVLVRAMANVLIVVLILALVFIFFKK